MTARRDGARSLPGRECVVLTSFVLGLALASGLVQARPLYAAHVAAIDARGLAAADTGSPWIVRHPLDGLAVVAHTGAARRSQNTESAGQAAAGFARITSAQLATMLLRKDFLLVNVHIPYEGEIAGTDAFIPYDKVADNLDKLPKGRDAKIVLYCRSGRMSEIAAREFTRLGYTVGLGRWNGRLEEDRTRADREVIPTAPEDGCRPSRLRQRRCAPVTPSMQRDIDRLQKAAFSRA